MLDNPAVQNGFGQHNHHASAYSPVILIKLDNVQKNRLSIDQAIADLIGDDTASNP